MRIIGGTHRSRNILPPKDDQTTRPITDRVKTSLFDRLTSMEAYDGHALDIFAGTGSLGLEALSRGMDSCTFIERDRNARDLLESNLETLGFQAKATVLSVDAFSAAWLRLLPHLPVNLIFLDPPYRMMADEKDHDRIIALMTRLAGVAAAHALMVLRTESHDSGPRVDGWNGPESFSYGSMTLHFYER